MPNKLRIITHLVTKTYEKNLFFLLNHVKEVNENIRLWKDVMPYLILTN